jgi:hypothetical protein
MTPSYRGTRDAVSHFYLAGPSFTCFYETGIHVRVVIFCEQNEITKYIQGILRNGIWID